jgi:hypothetical protein
LLPTAPFSTAFNTHSYIICLHRCYVLQYYWCSIIPFSFPSFSEVHRVKLWKFTITNMLYRWVFMWSCLFLCMCLFLDLSSTDERKCVACVFLSLAYFT